MQVNSPRARRRKTWKPDLRGYYTKQLGWIRTSSGKLQQHKFHLGKDLEEAREREQRLRALWNRFAKSATCSKELWPEPLLDVAKQIARGETTIVVKREPGEQLMGYSSRLDRIRRLYPVASFVAETPQLEADCDHVSDKFASIPKQDLELTFPTEEQMCARQEAARILAAAGLSAPFFEPAPSPPGPTLTEPRKPVLGVVSPRESRLITDGDPKTTEITQTGPRSYRLTHIDSGQVPGQDQTPVEPTSSVRIRTLHDGLSAYQAYIEKEYLDPETQRLSDWGWTQKKETSTLINHHPDQPLESLDADAIDDLFGYWRARPIAVRTGKPMALKSVSNYKKRLKAALRWMDRSSRISWTAPRSLNDFETRSRRLPSDDTPRTLEQVATFSLDELRLLMRYGQPLDRLLLLLGLNCGFGRAEIASLLFGEVQLFRGHTEREIELLQYETSDGDSFIKRVRRKSRVYGEHILFPLTVAGIQWAIEEREQFPDFDQNARLLLNKNGIPLDKPTAGGNSNTTIPNRLSRLIKRIKDDGHEIRKLSFGKLRKTAAQLIDSHSDGEVAGVFQCHGNPVATDHLLDLYRNRPFGRVFEAIRRVQEYLSPVFEEAGETPFVAQPQAYLKRSVIEELHARFAAGQSVEEIAREIGVSEMSVRRHTSAATRSC